MASRQKTREVFIELINLQLEPHGKTYADVVNESDWYIILLEKKNRSL